MGSPSPPLRVRLNRPALTGDLANALAEADCLAAPEHADTLLVVHRAAASEAEARVELAFFLRAWERGYAGVRAVVSER